jgi:hypothetical protein
MTCLVYGIYDVSRRNTYVYTVKSKEVAHELCLLEKNYAFKPIVVAESVDEARVLIRNNGDVE